MPDGEAPVIQMADELRAALLKRERATSVRLVREYGGIYQRLQAQIAALADEIATMERATANTVVRLARYRALMSRLDAELSRYGAWADTEITAASQVAAKDGEDHAELLALAVFPLLLRGQIPWRRVPAQDIAEALPFLAIDGPVRSALADEYAEAVSSQVADGVRGAVGKGTPIAAAIRAALGLGLVWVLKTARTMTVRAYNHSMAVNYQANPEVVTGWQWWATLDERCCISCVVMHGTIHSPEEILSDHHNGRCIALPVVRGRQPVEGTGKDWFTTLDEGAQQGIMGKAKWRAWKDGAFAWEDMSSVSTDPGYGGMRFAPSLKSIMGEQANEYYNWWRQ